MYGLQVGLSESMVLADFHEDAVKLYDATTDLQRVCSVLKNPSVRHNIQVHLLLAEGNGH